MVVVQAERARIYRLVEHPAVLVLHQPLEQRGAGLEHGRVELAPRLRREVRVRGSPALLGLVLGRRRVRRERRGGVGGGERRGGGGSREGAQALGGGAHLGELGGEAAAQLPPPGGRGGQRESDGGEERAVVGVEGGDAGSLGAGVRFARVGFAGRRGRPGGHSRRVNGCGGSKTAADRRRGFGDLGAEAAEQGGGRCGGGWWGQGRQLLVLCKCRREREDQYFPFPCSVLPLSFVPLLSIAGKKLF